MFQSSIILPIAYHNGSCVVSNNKIHFLGGVYELTTHLSHCYSINIVTIKCFMSIIKSIQYLRWLIQSSYCMKIFANEMNINLLEEESKEQENYNKYTPKKKTIKNPYKEL